MNSLGWKRFRNLLLTVGAVVAVICLVIMFFFRHSAFTGLTARLASILSPFICGAVIAYILLPVCRIIERWLARLIGKISKKDHSGLIRLCAIVLSLVLMLFVILFLLLMILPELINSISGIVSQLPDVVQRFSDWIAALDTGDPAAHEIVSGVQDVTETVTDYLQNFLQKTVLPNLQTLITGITSSFMGILNVVKNFGLGCIISAYFLGSWEKFAAQGKLAVYAIFPQRAADWIRKEVHYTDRMFNGFIHGKLLDSLIIGILCFIFCAVTNMPYAVLISVIVGVTNIIPFFGPYLGAIPSAILVLTVSPVKCLVFLIFVILLQQFDGNILGPSILGDQLGISGFWILFSILFFGSVWGLIGMLIGVPVFAVLYDLIRSFLTMCLQKRGRTDLVDSYHEKFSEKEKKKKKEKKKDKNKQHNGE